MATTTADAENVTIRIPSIRMEEVKEFARSQQRPVNDILVEAINRYMDKLEWERLKAYGRAQAQKLGYTEDDVERLIAEVRQEHGKDAA